MAISNLRKVDVPTVLPNSVEAEQDILFCILRNQAIQLEILSKLVAEDFYQTNHAIIFDAMQEIAGSSHISGKEESLSSINFATVVDCLRRNGKLAQVGDIDYILYLNELLPSAANYDEYLSIVKRASVMRKLINLCGEIQKRAYKSSNVEEVLSFAEEELFRLAQYDSNNGFVSYADIAARTMIRINERYVNPESSKGILTGFKRFDKMTNGLHGGELIVLAARPGVGKSTLAMNIAENVAKQSKTVAIYSLEMSNDQIVERLLSSMSGVPLQYIKNGQLPCGESDFTKLRNAQDTISTAMKVFGNDYANIRPSEISSQCRRLKAQHGLDLIVVDYIQLMNSDSKDASQGRQNEVASITRNLKLIAKELNVPVIALSQLKRDAEIRNIKDGKSSGGGEPVLSDLRESGAIEQDADIVLFIHKETDSQTGSTKHSLIVAKHRNGELGNIPIYMLGKIVRFVDDDYLNQHNIRAAQTAESGDGNSDESDVENMSFGGEESGDGTFIGAEDAEISNEE